MVLSAGLSKFRRAFANLSFSRIMDTMVASDAHCESAIGDPSSDLVRHSSTLAKHVNGENNPWAARRNALCFDKYLSVVPFLDMQAVLNSFRNNLASYRAK